MLEEKNQLAIRVPADTKYVLHITRYRFTDNDLSIKFRRHGRDRIKRKQGNITPATGALYRRTSSTTFSKSG